MTKRSFAYFRWKRLHKRLGCVSWKLRDLLHEPPIPKSGNLAIMLPGAGLTYHDGTAVEVDPKYLPPDPSTFSKTNNLALAMMPHIESYEKSWRQLCDAIRAAKHLIITGPNDERSVATGASSE